MKRIIGTLLVVLALVTFLWFHSPSGQEGLQLDASSPAKNGSVKSVPRPGMVPSHSDQAPDPGVTRPRESAEDIRSGLLKLLFESKRVELTDEDRDRAIAVINEVLEVKTEADSTRVTRHSADGFNLVAHVSAYPEQGAALKKILHDRLREEIGATGLEEIESKLADDLALLFAGFGQCEQRFVVSVTPDDNVLRIAWEHRTLPGSAEAVGFLKSEGSETTPRDLVSSGRYAFLGRLIEENLPRKRTESSSTAQER